MNSILKSDKWSSVRLLNEGWSRDEKYHLTDNSGNEYILRLSSIEIYDKKKWQFNILKKVDELNINAPKVIDFGISDDKVYILLSHLKGEKAEFGIGKLTNEEQYDLGIKAGIMLKKLHSIDVGVIQPSWYERHHEKTKRKLKKIDETDIRLPKMDIVKDYIIRNQDLMKNRPCYFQHGDYHLGNMLIQDKEIFIIDFDKSGIADPFDEFKPFCWNVYKSIHFENGLINGYFDSKIPDDFFPILAFYAAESLISHLPWAITYGKEEVDTAIKVFNDTMKWFDDFKTTVPTWFISNKKG